MNCDATPAHREVVLPLLAAEWKILEEAAEVERVRPLEVFIWQVLMRRARRVLKRRDLALARIRTEREERCRR